jgi:hypothetical protein
MLPLCCPCSGILSAQATRKSRPPKLRSSPRLCTREVEERSSFLGAHQHDCSLRLLRLPTASTTSLPARRLLRLLRLSIALTISPTARQLLRLRLRLFRLHLQLLRLLRLHLRLVRLHLRLLRLPSGGWSNCTAITCTASTLD